MPWYPALYVADVPTTVWAMAATAAPEADNLRYATEAGSGTVTVGLLATEQILVNFL